MTKSKISRSATGAIMLSGTAALMLSVAPVAFDDFIVSPAHAAGQGSGGSDGGGSGGSSGGGSGGSSGSGSGGSSGSGSGGNAGGSDAGNSAGQTDQGAAKKPSTAGGQGGDSGSSGGSAKQKVVTKPDTAGPAAGSQQAGNAGGSARADSGSDRDLADIMKDLTGDDSDNSDRPEWAGVPGGKDGSGGGQPSTAGSTKGDLFGDLFVIARDDNGVPILTVEGWVQPLDEFGALIPLDEEGHPVDETLTVEVELGRLNVGRAPTQVLDRRADEVITLMNTATDLTVDAAGRLVFTVDGELKTINSPLENLAIYTALMTTGSIPGVDDLPGTEFDFMVDGQLTAEDLNASPVFLAAATDKSGVFTADEIAYIDAFLGINIETIGSVTYSDIDYSSFDYDREDAYGDVTAEVLVLQDDGSWMPEVVNVYDEVFAGEPAADSGSLTAYTLAADDARSVVNFIHEYEVPATDLSN